MSGDIRVSLELLLGASGTVEIDLTTKKTADAQRVIDVLAPLCVDMALTDCAGADPKELKLPFHDLP